MSTVRGAIRHVFLWSYERGTIQYDIICALILAFIFFVPRSCFVSRKSDSVHPSVKQSQAFPQHAKANSNEKSKN